MMHTARDWTEAGLHPAYANGAPLGAEDAPVPLHLLQAAETRAQRDRMILLLLAGCALALAATAI